MPVRPVFEHSLLRWLLEPLSVIGLLLVLASPSPAAADGWKIQLQGVKALGLGYAGRALPEDASTVWFNPSGMTELPRTWTITAGGVWIPFNLDYTDAGSLSVLGSPLAGPRDVDGGVQSMVPVPHIYVVRKLSDRWWMGFGFNAPYGLTDDYGPAWVGRYHATESTLRVANFNSTFAVKATEDVSIGLGLDIQRSTATLANRIDFGSLGAAVGLPLVPQANDGGIVLNASDWGVGFDLSAAWRITNGVRAAVTYRSQATHTLDGTAEFDVPAGAALFQAGGRFSSTAATAVLPMPHELSLSTAIELTDTMKLVGDFTWTDWSRFERFVVSFANTAQPTISQDASYHDSQRVAGGLVYQATNRWTLRLGGLYENTPVPDLTRTPRLPEEDNLGFAAGGTFRASESWDVDFSWSHLIPHDADIRLSDPAAGSLTGRVRWKTDAVAIGISRRF